MPTRRKGSAPTSIRLYAPLARGLEALHSGQVGDYVAWVVAGLALFAIVFALA